MSRHEKLLRRFLSRPTDFTWSELKQLMEGCGFELKTTAGSGRKFIHRETHATHYIHEPHPSKILKAYQMRDAIFFLQKQGYAL